MIFTQMESQVIVSPPFSYMLLVKIHPAIPEPWQVQHERNIENGFTFFGEFVPTLCLKSCLKPLNKFLYSAYQRKEQTLGFPTMYQNNKSNEK